MKITKTEIPGLLVIESEIFQDSRGYFTEQYQKQKLIDLGFPKDFNIVQINNVYNNNAGVLRGIHAEPWEKFVGVVKGEALGVYLDLREGESFGKVLSVVLKPGVSVFIPKGVGNSYQTTQDDTYYSYAVSGHWQMDQKYIGVNPLDPVLAIKWPLDLENSIISDKDKNLPNLNEIEPWKGF